FDPEELLAYEIGMKSTFLDGSMRLNAAVFYYDYENAQVFNSVEDPVLLALPQNVVQNADELSIWGFDADFNWRPIDAWSITAGLGYTKSEFEDFELNVPGLDGIQTVQLQGETPQNTPEWSFSLQTSYTFGLGEAGSLTAYLDGSYRSEVLFSNGTVQEAGNPDTYFRNEEIGEDAYTLVNARLAWMDTSQQWEVALWGRNLADKEYAVYMFELTGLIGADQVLRGTPRTYGVDLRYVF
ncbi:MAG: TonB-dependent receptor, partial [Pseudomonadota bacterium]